LPAPTAEEAAGDAEADADAEEVVKGLSGKAHIQ
jgi:hypothetical protein